MGYWRQFFNSPSESTSLTGMQAGTTATVGAYRVPTSGTLKKLVIFIGSEAATSLVEDVRVEVTCTLWTPNMMEFAANGSGLRTATTPQHFPFEYQINQPVNNSVDINANIIHDSGVPVTSRVRIMGYVE